ncbi:MAG: hypothetical protein R6V10_02250 [bacterium]
MAEQANQDGVLNLKVGDSIISVLYKNPEPGELINTLVQKMPRGDEDEDAGRTLLANLELGRSCITGIAGGGPEWGKASEDESAGEWKERTCRESPLVLIALGQYLSRIPEFMEGDASKKS